MSTEELKEYLGIVVDMEKSIFLQRSLISKTNQEIEQLKIPKSIPDPVKPSEPMRPTPPSKTGFGWIIFAALALPFFEPTLGIGLLIAAGVVSDYLGSLRFIFLVPTLYFLIVVSYYFSKEKRECDSIKSEHVKNMEEYHNQMKKYQEAIESIRRQRQQNQVERETRALFLKTQICEIEKRLAISEVHLKTIYDKNIIFPKYRNFAMVASLYEYISAGRCSTLEGPEGAYNILETEMRLDRITCQLDQVITHLDKIQKNQFMLFSAVQDANCRMGKILDSSTHLAERLDAYYQNSLQLNEQATELNAHIAELQKTSELTAYQTERAKKELEYMNRMDYLTGRNDGVFWNHPPV